VDVSFLKITPAHTSQFAFIAISRESGNRTIFWHRGSVPPLKKEDVDLSPFVGARVLHLDGLMIEASIEAARQAKARGLKVSWMRGPCATVPFSNAGPSAQEQEYQRSRKSIAFSKKIRRSDRPFSILL